MIKLLYGKDLRLVGTLIGVGGIFAWGAEPGAVLQTALVRDDLPHSIRPEAPELYVDRDYVFFAAGLLSRSRPATAAKLLKNSLTRAKE